MSNTQDDQSGELGDYRKGLADTLVILNQSYDKLLVALAGGGLGLSIAFLKDVVAIDATRYPVVLFLAWFAFIASLACVLGRIYSGIRANLVAIQQVDDGRIYDEHPGGVFSRWTTMFHSASAIALVVGLVLIATFSYLNVGVHDDERRKEAAARSAPETEGTTTQTETSAGSRSRKAVAVMGSNKASTAAEEEIVILKPNRAKEN